MLWQRSEPLKSPHERQLTIPGSDLVRQAALRASWQRDRRVAQRRIAWRWTVWYIQRYSPHVLVGMLVVAGTAYLTGHLPSWPDDANRPDKAEAAVARVPYSPPSVPTAPPVNAPVTEPSTGPDVDVPLTLRAAQTLGVHEAVPLPVTETGISPDTLTLKPENWLHSKEP